MTGIFATIANIARDKAAAASQQAENDPSLSAEDVIDLKAYAAMLEALGRVDKRDSPGAVIVIQAGICNGDQRGTKPDVERRVGVL